MPSVGTKAVEPDVAAACGVSEPLFIGGRREGGDGVDAGSDSGELEVWCVLSQCLSERVAPASIAAADSSEVPVVPAGPKEPGQCELLEDRRAAIFGPLLLNDLGGDTAARAANRAGVRRRVLCLSSRSR
jgi:hypothetical protein